MAGNMACVTKGSPPHLPLLTCLMYFKRGPQHLLEESSQKQNLEWWLSGTGEGEGGWGKGEILARESSVMQDE